VTTADLSCPDPRCLTGLEADDVAAEVMALLALLEGARRENGP
jgi:hypothetical protein